MDFSALPIPSDFSSPHFHSLAHFLGSGSVPGYRVNQDLSQEVGDILLVMLGSRVQTLTLVVVSGLIVGCSQVQRDKTIAVPQFSIAVKLSETARKKLQGIHESVLVIAYFDGDPLPGKGKDNSPMRGVVLGSSEKLVDDKNIATFADTKISQSNWDDLSDKNYFVTINVVSARKSSKDNLLDCADPINRISTFVGKSTQVSCRLIGERDPSSQ